jgi:hypothetical protein
LRVSFFSLHSSLILQSPRDMATPLPYLFHLPVLGISLLGRQFLIFYIWEVCLFPVPSHRICKLGMKTRSRIETFSLKTHLLPSSVSRNAQISERFRRLTTEQFCHFPMQLIVAGSYGFFAYFSITGSRNISCALLNDLHDPLPSPCRFFSLSYSKFWRD